MFDIAIPDDGIEGEEKKERRRHREPKNSLEDHLKRTRIRLHYSLMQGNALLGSGRILQRGLYC